jgi:hypothetical protein
MIEDMMLAGFRESTRKEYVRSVAAFARQFGCSPELIEEERVRIYLLHLRDVQHVARGTFQVKYSALKFLYQTTRNLGWPLFAKKTFANPVKGVCRIP